MGYCVLEFNKGYLKAHGEGSIDEKTIDKAIAWAREEIDGTLGKRWSTDLDDDTAGTPRQIERIAEKLAAGEAIRKSQLGDLDVADAASDLIEEARADLRRLLSGAVGLKLRNGAWDPKYPGSNNSEEGRSRSRLRFICG